MKCICGAGKECDGEFEYMARKSYWFYYKHEILSQILIDKILDEKFLFEQHCENKFLKQFYNAKYSVWESKSKKQNRHSKLLCR